MKRACILLVSFLVVCFLVGCATDKDVVYEQVINRQIEEGGTEIFDKVIVYKLSSNRNSKKDSICYYKDGRFLGSTVIITKIE